MIDLIRKYGLRSLALVAVTAAAIAAAPAAAQGHGGGHGGGGYHGGGYHGGGWHGGGWHGGGWGWGVGIGFYDPWWPGYYGGYPYYPYYADPPVTVIQQPMAVAPQQQVQQAQAPATYYYCDDPAGYYPYVQNCGKPWRPVPAVPQSAPPQQ
ncbi:MAG TPA: hypothetical protein VKP60_21390 [Magnetospirillaceae bacterium]|nr:hypothetical protein [Magnetospirillaceae bacterium]